MGDDQMAQEVTGETNRSQDHPRLYRKELQEEEEENAFILIGQGLGLLYGCPPTQALVSCMSQSPIHPVTCQIKARTICLPGCSPSMAPQGK